MVFRFDFLLYFTFVFCGILFLFFVVHQSHRLVVWNDSLADFADLLFLVAHRSHGSHRLVGGDGALADYADSADFLILFQMMSWCFFEALLKTSFQDASSKYQPLFCTRIKQSFTRLSSVRDYLRHPRNLREIRICLDSLDLCEFLSH